MTKNKNKFFRHDLETDTIEELSAEEVAERILGTFSKECPFKVTFANYYMEKEVSK